jgi:hypothetical protein
MKIHKLLNIIGICIFLTSCFEDRATVSSSPDTVSSLDEISKDDPNFFDSEQGFPLDQQSEISELNILNKSDCIGDINCTLSEMERLADDFSFRSGKLVLRGNTYKYNSDKKTWAINKNIEVISYAFKPELLETQKESDFHFFADELNNYTQLKDGVNKNLSTPLRPIIVTQGKLGLNELSNRDPGLCDVFAAENFERQSTTPWAKYKSSTDEKATDYHWPIGTGYNENNDTYSGETLIICGEISTLNRTLKLEAKNIIFYNSHIKIMSDRDMPSGLRVIAENIGYFGANVIESNIINKASGHKNSSAPTIDIGVSGQIVQIDSTAPINNRFNAHYFKIFMAEHE